MLLCVTVFKIISCFQNSTFSPQMASRVKHFEIWRKVTLIASSVQSALAGFLSVLPHLTGSRQGKVQTTTDGAPTEGGDDSSVRLENLPCEEEQKQWPLGAREEASFQLGREQQTEMVAVAVCLITPFALTVGHKG